MHRLILRLKRKDILRALRPGLPIMRVDMGQHMGNAVLEVGDSMGIGVEVSGAVPLAVKVRVGRQRIVAMDRDQQLDAVLVRLVHDVVEAVEDGVIPGPGGVALETGEWVQLGSFLGVGLPCMVLAHMSFKVRGYTIKPDAKDLYACTLETGEQGILLRGGQACSIVEVGAGKDAGCGSRWDSN